MTPAAIILSYLLVPLGALVHALGDSECISVQNEPCNPDYVQFYLYTRENVTSPRVISHLDNEILSSGQNRTVKVIFHGYNSNSRDVFLLDIKNEYLKKEDVDVWMVDYSAIAKGPCYLETINNIPYVGNCTSQLIQKLASSNPGIYNTLHLIGFSVGAHVTASTANFLKPNVVPRITGLDPAMPLMQLKPWSEKLNRDAAQFVDAVHTNCFIQGQIEPSGHVDFYMNDGTFQPGCTNETLFDGLNCDHHRSVQYFAESINSKVGFWGWKCLNFLNYFLGLCKSGDELYLMGDEVSRNHTGVFRAMTNSQKPFAMGKNSTQIRAKGFKNWLNTI